MSKTKKSAKGQRRCSFCQRPFVGDKRYSYCTVACREGIVRADPQRHCSEGFFAPAEGPTDTLWIHAVSPPNQSGKRTAACGEYGRFVTHQPGEWVAFDPERKGSCKRCVMALNAWATPSTVEELAAAAAGNG